MNMLLVGTSRVAGTLALVSLVGGLALLAGCTTGKEKQPGLLGPRHVVPPPYTEPVAPAAVQPPAAPIEPMVLEPAEPAKLGVAEQKTGVTPAPRIESKIVTHKIVANDSMWKIGWTYGVSVSELASFNDMKANAKLQVGKTLRIPPGGHFVPLAKRPMPKAKAAPVKKEAHAAGKAGKAAHAVHAAKGGEAETAKTGDAPAATEGKYKVQKGDTPAVIAKKLGVKVAALKAANSITNDKGLQIGQELVIPKGGEAPKAAEGTAPAVAPMTGTDTTPVTPAPTAPETGAVTPPAGAGEVAVPPGATPPAPGTGTPAAAAAVAGFTNTLEHTVLEGETMETIAEMYEAKTDDILKANPQVKSNADLKPNMTIVVPYK